MRDHAMSHCNFPFSLQLLCPDEDDLKHISLCAGPELNPTERALAQSSCGLLQLSSCFFPGLQAGGGQMAFSASAHAAQAQTTKLRVRHEEELIALAYFPEEK